MKILLIEDDPFLIDIYKTKLEEEEFKVDIALDGEQGIRKVKEENFDVILLDIVLPHIDGWEILESFKRQGLLEKTKVIVLSNLGQKEEVEKGKKMGAAKYLIKALYTPSQVVEEIKSLFK